METACSVVTTITTMPVALLELRRAGTITTVRLTTTRAAAGFAAGSLTDMLAKNEAQQKYLDGYNKGRSDAIKELYWVKRDAERPSAEQTVQRRYYEVPVPEHITTDGVLVAPHKRVIEVVE